MAAKGQTKSGGRKRGTPNRLGKEVRELVREALDRAGGAEYLLRAAKEQPQAFMSLLGRLVPSEIKGVIETDIKVVVTTGIPGSPGSEIGTAGTEGQRFAQSYIREQAAKKAWGFSLAARRKYRVPPS